MNTPALLFGLGSGGAAAFLFRMAKQEMANKKLAAKLKMSRVSIVTAPLNAAGAKKNQDIMSSRWHQETETAVLPSKTKPERSRLRRTVDR
ncbi:MAG: hypothetical protein HGJ93_18050 [Desulfosarcina sp.]|nr:hypothetical protein [Desulfosarcina sp.]MBC2767784.1 hypothetical protein [Desulfosarcina sp.]